MDKTQLRGAENNGKIRSNGFMDLKYEKYMALRWEMTSIVTALILYAINVIVSKLQS